MFISTIIFIVWIVLTAVEGTPLFDWWWIPIMYILEIFAYIIGFIALALTFGR